MMKCIKFLIFIGDIWLRAKENDREMAKGESRQCCSTLKLLLSLLYWFAKRNPARSASAAPLQSEQSAPQALLLSLKTNIEYYVNRRCHFQVCQLQTPVFARGI